MFFSIDLRFYLEGISFQSKKDSKDPQGGGGGGGGWVGGTLIFYAYVGSDPTSTVHPKNIRNFKHPKNYLKF